MELNRVGATEGGPKAKEMLDLTRPTMDFVALATGCGGRTTYSPAPGFGGRGGARGARSLGRRRGERGPLGGTPRAAGWR